METNMTTEKALEILERHNLWRRGADYVEATDPRLLGMALDKAIEVLRLSIVSGSAEDFYSDLMKLINAHCSKGLNKPELVARMEYATYSCKMS